MPGQSLKAPQKVLAGVTPVGEQMVVSSFPPSVHCSSQDPSQMNPLCMSLGSGSALGDPRLRHASLKSMKFGVFCAEEKPLKSWKQVLLINSVVLRANPASVEDGQGWGTATRKTILEAVVGV